MPGKERSKKKITSVSPQPLPPIVGIGASAGGLEALKMFFSNVSETSKMAYVVVAHMSPTQPSLLPELLRKVTALPVLVATDGQLVQVNHIYINSPGKEIGLHCGVMQLRDLETKVGHFTIDSFFKSLALDKGSRAAGVILSGTGTDGTDGIRTIKEHGGLVLVQDDETATYKDMPRNAINTGLVDKVLPPDLMPGVLDQCLLNSGFDCDTKTMPRENVQSSWLNKVFAILRIRTGHDFSAYKTSTTLRRIGRRMNLVQLENHEAYVRYLQENQGEVEELFRDLLIGVTNFFREPNSFMILKGKIIPQLLHQKAEDGVFRVWVPGCSTGEEVYSLAIILDECLDSVSGYIALQIFATDINSIAINKARQGVYPASIANDVSQERLKRFFVKEGDCYRVRKRIREYVIFSTQDVIKDPPFSRLDLLCCRNLLIYLNSESQRKLLPLFHYTLIQGGILMLGSSETVGGFSNLFEILDKKQKIFKKREVAQALKYLVDFPAGRPQSLVANTRRTQATGTGASPPDFAKITQEIILNNYAPVAILIDGNGEILYLQGRTGKYLEAPNGPPTQNIFDLARDGLRYELASAVRQAKTSAQKVTRPKIAVRSGDVIEVIDLHICPQSTQQEVAGRFLVLFEELHLATTDTVLVPEGLHHSMIDLETIAVLEKELQSIREMHQCVTEELESSNEELKSTNEELQSANEELQSTNEELESSKEELQSLNEELQTVNAEMQSKVDELFATHDDMHNLLNSTDIATIFLDNQMCLRRYTKEAIKLINLIPTDIGRPLKQVVTNLVYEHMMEDVQEVLTTLVRKEVEVQTTDATWYTLRIVPCRTMDNRIGGVVITFIDINNQKLAQDLLEKNMSECGLTWNLVSVVFDTTRQALAVLNPEGEMVIANHGLSKILDLAKEGVRGMDFLKALTVKAPDVALDLEFIDALKKQINFKSNIFVIPSNEKKAAYYIEGKVIVGSNKYPHRFLVKLINARRGQV